MVESDAYLERLRELNVNDPASLVRTKMTSYAKFAGLSLNDAMERFLAEAKLFDEAVKLNHREILESGLGLTVLRKAHDAGHGEAFAERQLVVVDGWSVRGTRGVKRGDEPGELLSITNRRVLGEPNCYQAPFALQIGRPNQKGLLWLAEGIEVEDYDVVAGCAQRLLDLEREKQIPFLSAFMDRIELPDSLMRGVIEPLPRDPIDYSGIVGSPALT